MIAPPQFCTSRDSSLPGFTVILICRPCFNVQPPNWVRGRAQHSAYEVGGFTLVGKFRRPGTLATFLLDVSPTLGYH